MKTKSTTNTSLSDNTHFILYNTANYKSYIENSASDILNKYVEVLIEYMRFISEKIMMKNKLYYRFIFERGVETITHVFSVIFYYTKNLELTFYHSQKAYYFYIEFIEQISDDNVTFLQLSSRDAILFVYKKTIFDLNNEYRKNILEPTTEDKKIMMILDSHTYIYKNIIKFIIYHNDFKYETKMDYINKCCDSIEFISMTLNIASSKIKGNYMDCLYLFIILLADKKIDILDFFRVLNEFIKKIIIKKKIDEKVIKNKIYDSEINNFINNNELNMIVEWIFSD
jgi:flagellin-specific chaperone FliS